MEMGEVPDFVTNCADSVYTVSGIAAPLKLSELLEGSRFRAWLEKGLQPKRFSILPYPHAETP